MERLGLRGVAGSGFPVINFTGGYPSVGYNSITHDDEQIYMLRNALIWFKGKHNLKAGLEHRVLRTNIRS